MTIRDIAIAFGFNVDEQSAHKAEDTIKNLKSMGTKLLGAISIGFSLSKMKDLSEEFNGYNDILRDSTGELGDQAEIQKKMLQTANDTRSAYGETVAFASKLRKQDEAIFDSVEKTLGFVELTTKAFKATGKSQQDVKALQEIMNKTFAVGKVTSGEFQQLMEKSPETVGYLQDALGKTKEQLIQMAAEGSISSAALYDSFALNADKINRKFGTLDLSISDAMVNIRNKWGLWIDDMNDSLGITSTISRYMVDGFSKVMTGLNKASDVAKRFIDRVGGIENAFKLMAVAGSLVWAALNAQKIMGFIKSVGGLLGGVNKQMIMAKIKIFAVLAVILLIYLLIDDFISFMKGNDSVIGELFKKAGIDANEARETILQAWNTIKSFLLGVWDTIKRIATKVWSALKDFWKENGQGIKDTMLSVWKLIWSVLKSVWEAIADIAKAIFSALQAFWAKWGDKIKAHFAILWETLGGMLMGFLKIIRGVADFLSGVFTGDWEKAWEGIKTIFQGVWDVIWSYIKGMLKAIGNLFGVSSDEMESRIDKLAAFLDSIWKWICDAAETAFSALQAFWGKWGGQITEQFSILWEFLGGLIEAFLLIVQGIIDFIVGVFTGDWEKAWEGIKKIFEGILDGIENAWKMIWDTIDNWFGEKIDAIKEKLFGFVDTVKEKFAQIKGFFSGIGETVGDFFTGGDYTATVQTATAGVAADAAGRNSSVTQYNEFNNTFNGGERAAQVDGSSAMKQSGEDAAKVLEDAATYGR